MKIVHTLHKPVIGLLGLLVLLLFAHLTWGATCKDVSSSQGGRGYLNIMTINLLFSEVENREARFNEIAKFAQSEAHNSNPIDVFLLQEATGGSLVGTENSAEDLRDTLQDLGLDYELRTAFETGLPGVLATANAVLSRCDISLKLGRFLPLTSESVQIGDLVIPIARNVMMVRLKIPGFGKMNVYNTHLCAGDCTVDELGKQVEALLDFVDQTEQIFSVSGHRPYVLGGDFNMDNFRGEPTQGVFGPEKLLYDTIIDAGFVDAYAVAVGESLEELCEDPNNPDEHCTVGVSLLNGSKARRIDYLFASRRRFSGVSGGEVVFNPLGVRDPEIPTVSDHAAVLVRVNLP